MTATPISHPDRRQLPLDRGAPRLGTTFARGRTAPLTAGRGVRDNGATLSYHHNRGVMSRRTKVLTFSLPPEMAEQVRQVMEEEGRTMSELIREALRTYMQEREWNRLVRYGQRRAREQGITPEEVERLVNEHRAKTQPDSSTRRRRQR